IELPATRREGAGLVAQHGDEIVVTQFHTWIGDGLESTPALPGLRRISFDRILIETVGVGQTELEVVGMAEQVLVLLVPESGDVIQTMKAGLLEGADVFAVNKCDRPGADLLIRGLVAMIEEGANLHGSERAPVFGVSALSGDGMDSLLEEL
ncbi:MAG TPA: hypothetical protein EYQ27_08100, partial [Gemmatimonadetes bacterium]|nr:hypothetical protein [Gemmatimonadota bacterium]